MCSDPVSSSIFKAGGFDDSCSFNLDVSWMVYGVVPGVNTGSAAIRLISNVALALFNTIKTMGFIVGGMGQWAFSKEVTCFDLAHDSIKAVGVNIAACVYSIFEAIPVVGNIPYWYAAVSLCLGGTPFTIFNGGHL